MNTKYKRILLKLSGESLMGEKQYGIDEKKLAEYDPQGTREFMESHGIQIADAPKQKPKNKSQRER